MTAQLSSGARGDPLAVMDDLIAFGSRGVERDDPAREMLEAAHEARAAVAELVAADRAYNMARANLHFAVEHGKSNVDSMRFALAVAEDRRAAALAPFSEAQS